MYIYINTNLSLLVFYDTAEFDLEIFWFSTSMFSFEFLEQFNINLFANVSMYSYILNIYTLPKYMYILFQCT